jgi:phage terminase large subunit
MIINDCYLPLLKSTDRFLILWGSASSGKSVFCAQKLVLRTISEKGHIFLALRKVATTVKKSIFKEIQDVIADNDMASEWKINKAEYTFTHLLSGNQIYCMGLDDPEKVKSIKGITGMWLEEVTEFNKEDLDQLNLRIRGKKDNYVQYLMSFNPIDERHWLKSKYFDTPKEGVSTIKTTYKDNYFLTDEDRSTIEGLKTSNELYYQVYCLGDWGVVDTSNKFLYNFKKDIHVSECGFNPNKPLKISFDFNLEPFAVIIYQSTTNGIVVFDKVRLDNSDIYAVCDRIRAEYPNSFYIVTGDRTGYNRSGVVRGTTSYWKIIKKELELAEGQIRLRTRNLNLIQSRVLCNSALKFKSVTIHPSLIELINDCLYAQVDQKGELIKDRNKNQNDFLDTLRYAMDAEFPELIKGVK